jgi:F0F1-type ATP synthase assembly protein I
MQKDSGRNYGRLVRQIGLVTTIPMIFAAGPLVGYWIGQWVDRSFGWEPWGTVGLSLLGFIASLKQVAAIIRRWIKEEQES